MRVKPVKAEKRRQYAAMLQSMAASFRISEQTGRQVFFSFHPIDMAEMLEDAAAIVEPRLATAQE